MRSKADMSQLGLPHGSLIYHTLSKLCNLFIMCDGKVYYWAVVEHATASGHCSVWLVCNYLH